MINLGCYKTRQASVPDFKNTTKFKILHFFLFKELAGDNTGLPRDLDDYDKYV